MSKITIKPEHLRTVVAFGNSGSQLGNRDDLYLLGIIAHESGDPSILQYFENLPPLADLLKEKTNRELKAWKERNR